MSRILFKKEGRAKFISHLDLMRTMQRVFIRSGIEIKHTEGFNPHPYMNFAMPLPVGTESRCELMDFVLLGGAQAREVPARLNASMPEGIRVLDCWDEKRKFKDIKWLDMEARLFYDNKVSPTQALRDLYSGEHIVIEKRTKRGSAQVDIAALHGGLEITEAEDGAVLIAARLPVQEPALSPAQLISAIEQLRPDLRPDFAAYRRVEVRDSELRPFR